jgi:hypothetical protein
VTTSRSSLPPPDSFPEKRTFLRYALWFPVTLIVEGKDGEADAEYWSICRDASPGGIQVSSLTLIPIGTVVSACFRVAPHGAPERSIEATVVRSETSDDELMLAFPFRLGLRFTTPVPELLDELERQTRRDGG